MQHLVGLSAASGKDITVDYATSNGTATAGSDYTATRNIKISAGATSGTFNVPVCAYENAKQQLFIECIASISTAITITMMMQHQVQYCRCNLE